MLRKSEAIEMDTVNITKIRDDRAGHSQCYKNRDDTVGHSKC